MQAARQTTRHVFMVRPRAFGPNAQTAASNAFQQPADRPAGEIHERALREFGAMTATLRDAGIAAIVFEDTDEPVTPDAIFPNNWISCHADGRVFLYPMEAQARRRERRLDIVEALSTEHGFHVSEIVDLSFLEDGGLYLEGTGSMVLDRVNHVIYAALSSRTHMDALAEFAQRADYEIAAFEAVDERSRPVYHTNVMMALGEKFGVICAESIADIGKRSDVVAKLNSSGRAVVEITLEQMRGFVGNMLELESAAGEPVVVLSRNAYDSLTAAQLRSISACARLLPIDVGTIERFGGGSVRCMLAEIFLPEGDA
ncbi:MAG: citrulline utilization hydrolase CtlX [Gammaproteobacteria bacterium]